MLRLYVGVFGLICVELNMFIVWLSLVSVLNFLMNLFWMCIICYGFLCI